MGTPPHGHGRAWFLPMHNNPNRELLLMNSIDRTIWSRTLTSSNPETAETSCTIPKIHNCLGSASVIYFSVFPNQSSWSTVGAAELIETNTSAGPAPDIGPTTACSNRFCPSPIIPVGDAFISKRDERILCEPCFRERERRQLAREIAGIWEEHTMVKGR